MRITRLCILLLAIPLVSRGELPDLAADALTAATYRPKAIVTTANRLIALGKADAETSLLQYAEMTDRRSEGDKSYYLAWLCLLVFDPKPDSGLPRPEFGGPGFPATGETFSRPLGRMNSASWPRFPLALSHGVPFLLVPGHYMLFGTAEGEAFFLRRCEANGSFRTAPYAIPTPANEESALSELLTSPAWKSLEWHESASSAHRHDFENRETDFLRRQLDVE